MIGATGDCLVAVLGKTKPVEASANRGAAPIKVHLGKASQGCFRSGDSAGLVLRVKDRDEKFFSTALADNFVHPHARPILESHPVPSQ